MMLATSGVGMADWSCGRLLLGFSLLLVACGDDDGPAEPRVATGPAPAEMCAAEEEPAVAAFDRQTGEYMWSVCSTDRVIRTIQGASDDAVHVDSVSQSSGQATTNAYSAADGTEVEAGALPTNESLVTQSPDGERTAQVGGIRVVSSQEGPTSAIDSSTGEELWTGPGSLAYDDVWAIDDGAIYVLDTSGAEGPRLIAYEIDSGDIRWERSSTWQDGGVGWPWRVQDGELFAMWNNLEVISTDDGTTIWHTEYPPAQFSRMTGVTANDDTVFVAFSSVASGGD